MGFAQLRGRPLMIWEGGGNQEKKFSEALLQEKNFRRPLSKKKNFEGHSTGKKNHFENFLRPPR